MPNEQILSLEKLKAEGRILRAGSDYLGTCWSINIVGEEYDGLFEPGQVVTFVHADGSYKATFYRVDNIRNVKSYCFTAV